MAGFSSIIEGCRNIYCDSPFFRLGWSGYHTLPSCTDGGERRLHAASDLHIAVQFHLEQGNKALAHRPDGGIL